MFNMHIWISELFLEQNWRILHAQRGHTDQQVSLHPLF